MTQPLHQWVVALLHTTHFLSIAVWMGAMLFNLVVNFPATRSRVRSPSDYVGAMSALSRRAGPWLYLLVVLTALSGWSLSLIRGESLLDATFVAKCVFLIVMLLLHMWGTFRLWPQIHFGLESEWPKLLLQYQLTMAFSSALGIAAILLTYSRGAAASVH